MAWTTDDQDLIIRVIAAVESSGLYDAVNPRDPITLGLSQWFGPRAANLCNRMRADNPMSWGVGGALSALEDDLRDHPDNSRWWNTRYLSGDEVEAIRPVLRANHGTQYGLASEDIDDYRQAAEDIAIDEDTNKQAVMFFMVMYHQTPKRAVEIVNTLRPSSSIDRLYAGAMNDGTFSKYRTRYTQARDYIKNGNPPLLSDEGDDSKPISDGDGNQENSTDDALTQLKASIKYLDVVGDSIHVRLTEGTTLVAVPDGRGHFMLPAHEVGKGEAVPVNDSDNTPLDPDVPEDEETTGSTASAKLRSKLVSWGKARIGAYTYTNGPARVNPEVTGATDCSGFTKAMYLAVAGIKLGQITSQQYTQGRRIATGSGTLSTAQLRVGDLIYFHWANPRWNSGKVTDHVEMYIGNGNCIGHPGPGRGPRILGLAPQIGNADRWWVQRHIED